MTVLLHQLSLRDHLAAVAPAPTPIEVKIAETGDLAEADSPEAAITAARTLRDEARADAPNNRPTVIFLVDGKHVRSVSTAGGLS